MTVARTVTDALAERTTLEIACVAVRRLTTKRTCPRATRLQRTIAVPYRDSNALGGTSIRRLIRTELPNLTDLSIPYGLKEPCETTYTAKDGAKSMHCCKATGGQGVHRELEPERHEDKYRAVIEEQPMMNRSAKDGQGRAGTMAAKVFLSTTRPTKVCKWSMRL